MLTQRQQPDGTFVLRLPMDGDAPVPMVDARQDTGKYSCVFQGN